MTHASSLSNLASNIKNLPNLKSHFSNQEETDLLSQKGIYPYENMDSFEKFKETQLPSRESFHGKLNKTHISDRYYTQAKKVWEKFNIKNLGEYHDLCLKTDVLLLGDVFETF